MIPHATLLDPAREPADLAAEYGLPLRVVKRLIREAERAEVRRRLLCGYTQAEVRADTGASKAFIRKIKAELDATDPPSYGQYIAMLQHLLSQMGKNEMHLQIKVLAQLKEAANYGVSRKTGVKARQLKTVGDVRRASAEALRDLYNGDLSPAALRTVQPLLRLASQLADPEKDTEQWDGAVSDTPPMTAESARARTLQLIQGGRRRAIQ